MTHRLVPRPPAPERSLKVALRDGNEALLLGNPHTFEGRFNVRTADGDVRTCSLSEIAGATPEAWAWLVGYLSGSELSAYSFFGAAADELADDSLEMRLWRELAARFRETGRLQPPDMCANCHAYMLSDMRSYPRCLACGQERDDDEAEETDQGSV
jgi:hypothetical protein